MGAITATWGITPTVPLTGTYVLGAYGSNAIQTLVDYAQIACNVWCLLAGVMLVFYLVPREM